MPTIYIIENGETAETYEDPAAYDIENGTVTIQAGRGTMRIQLGEGQTMRTDEPQESGDHEDPGEAADMLEALKIMGVEADG